MNDLKAFFFWKTHFKKVNMDFFVNFFMIKKKKKIVGTDEILEKCEKCEKLTKKVNMWSFKITASQNNFM